MDAPKSLTGGEALIDGLITLGANRIFCVPGESYLAALDALHDRSADIEVITCRQEGGASYMAEAHGKLTGLPGICFVSRGPGASNAMIGVHTAFQDSTPMLLFIGQVSRADRGREAFQELDYATVFGGVAKRVLRIDHAAQLPEQLNRAWHWAVDGRPGPVIVELPEDMLKDPVPAVDFRPLPVNVAAPRPGDMASFSELLTAAREPLFIVGGAGWTAGATDHLQALAADHDIGVITAFRRTDCFDNTLPQYLGELGIRPNPELVKRVQASDLLVAVGPRLGDMTTTGYTTLVPPDRTNCAPGQKLVHVHPSADEIGSVFRADLGIVSQPEAFLAAARELPASAGDARAAQLETGHRHYLDWLHLPRNEGAALRMDQVMATLREHLDETATVSTGAGNFSVWGQRNVQFRRHGTFLGSTNGSMGYGVPSAIAAKLQHPERTVVSFSGDGCFMMNGQELATACQYRANVLFMVVNNCCLGTIRSHQEMHYPGRPSATRLENPDFVALARAYGAWAERVETTEAFEAALVEALAQTRDGGRPALLELVTDY